MGPVADVLVTVYFNRTAYHFPLGPIDLNSTTVTEIDLAQASAPPGIDSATITITFEDPTGSQINESQLLVK